MSNKKEKTIRKIRKKRIWPSIVAFICFLGFVALLIMFLIFFFSMYMVGMKVLQEYDDIERTGEVIDTTLATGKSWNEAVEIARFFMKPETEFYVDYHGKTVFGIGEGRPDFSESITLDLDKQYRFYAEAGNVGKGHFMGFHIPVEELVRRTFTGEREMVYGRAWLQEIIWQEFFWTPVPLSDTSYEMYVRFPLQLQRQDVFYTFMVIIIASILLLIPICFMFINMIRVVLTQRKMLQLLYLDSVTGGRNWLYFQNATHKILRRPMNSRRTFAVVNLHMDRYQNFCACYGVKEGESLLEGMDALLKARISRKEAFARFEAADFALLLRCEGENEQQVREVCQKRVNSLLAELTGLRTEMKVHFQAGVYMIYPLAADIKNRFRYMQEIDIDQVYNYANAARMSTLNRGIRGVTFFDENMLKEQLWVRKVEDTMEGALLNEEFQVYLQPKYSPVDARLVGAEALVRWISPTEGFVPPNRFIPIFEDNGFIVQLDDYMISHVAKLQAEWRLQGIKTVPVSVNISRAHFSQEGLAEHICQLVDSYGPSHNLIELEVTESAFFDDKDILINTVKQLKAYGFGVSMDDFGAGYSSLNSLKDIPLDVLKIDGEFFRGEDDNPRGRIVIQETIQLARHLEMKVVAEGIEKEEQVAFLAEQGCDMIQGYYFAKPMPVHEFIEKVEKDA